MQEEKIYNITLEIMKSKSYLVGASDIREAQTKALEAAIKEHPGADVWVRGMREVPHAT